MKLQKKRILQIRLLILVFIKHLMILSVFNSILKMMTTIKNYSEY